MKSERKATQLGDLCAASPLQSIFFALSLSKPRAENCKTLNATKQGDAAVYLIDFDPQALAVTVFLSCGPDTGPFLWFNVVLACFLAVENLMRTLIHGYQGFSNTGAPCGRTGGGRGGGRGVLADFVAHLLGDITQALRY